MLVKEILKNVGLNITLPNNLFNEDLEDVVPKDYVKKGDQYVISFKDSTFRIIINVDGSEEFFIMTESFEDIPDTYVSYDINGKLYKVN